jgi:hypothetical protein
MAFHAQGKIAGERAPGYASNPCRGSAVRVRRNRIDGQFSPRLIEMLESPAWRVLSLSARRIIDRVEIELAHHGGTDNGKLPITYQDFIRYGIDGHAVAAGIREAEALGLLAVVHGRAGNAEFRTPNRYRLTYRNTDHDNPTHNWRRIISVEEAKAIAVEARNETSKKAKFQWGKTQCFDGEIPHRKNNSPMGETSVTAIPEKPSSLSISRGAVRGS